MKQLYLDLTELEVESLESLDGLNSAADMSLSAVVTGHGMTEIGASCAGSNCGSCCGTVCPPSIE
jgi:hypothetical protein